MKKCIASILSLMVLCFYSHAQSWKTVNPGPDYHINCMITDSVNNLLYVGGGFTQVGAIPTSYIAVYNGSSWSSLDVGLNMEVSTLAMYNGELYAGGYFTKSGDSIVNYIAKWDGTKWKKLGSGMNNPVTALAVFNGELYAGGNFTIAGGITVNRIAKWNGTNWSSVGSGFDNIVYTLLSYNGNLYAGGEFLKTIDNTIMNGIAKWDGNSWQPLGSGISGRVESLCEYKNELYIGGAMSSAGDSTVKNIAKWNGVMWSGVNANPNNAVYALKALNGKLYVGGTFIFFNNVATYYVAVFDGVSWNDVGSGLSGAGSSNTVRSFCVYNNDLYAGGRFSLSGSTSLSNIARWPSAPVPKINQDKMIICAGDCIGFYDKSYNTPTSWKWTFTGANPSTSNLQNPGSVCYGTAGTYPVSLKVTNQHGSDSVTYNSYIKVSDLVSPNFSSFGANFNSTVDAIAFDSVNNILYAGGHFTKVNGVTANYIAKYDGNSWSALGQGMNSFVFDLQMYKGDLYAAGYFTLADSGTAKRIARWDGNTWNSLGSGLNYDAVCLEVFNNELYVGGTFTNAGGISADRMAKWDGNNWYSVSAQPSGLNGVADIKGYNGELYVGGCCGEYIKKWDGLNWGSLGSGLDGNIRSLGVYKNSLIVGGSFYKAGSLTVDRIAKWDGSNWNAMGGADGEIYSIREHNNDLYIAGLFINVGGVPARKIAKWNSSSWQAVGSGINSTIFSMEFVNDELYIGGDFTLVNSCDYANYMAKWPAAPKALFSVSDSSICMGDSITLINQSKNASQWEWLLTGAQPFFSIEKNPIISYANTGTYDIRLVASNINGQDTLIIKNYISVDSCTLVWPGDSDNNKIADNNDLLPIGLFFGQNGISRDSIGNNWQGYFSLNWGTTQTNSSDIKHIDCNGDGVIDNNDTLAVNLNFNLTHAVTPSNNQERLAAPDLYFVTGNNTYNSGDFVDVEVWLGTLAMPVNNLYGVAFNINYNASLVQPSTESLTYPNSWLGTPGANAIKISKIDPIANTAYGAKTRINHMNADGYGKIADFKFQLKNSIASNTKMFFSISGYKANDSIGAPILLNTMNDSIIINPTATGIKETSDRIEIIISPNPFSSQTNIFFSTGIKNATIKIVDVIGKEVRKINFSGNQLVIEKGELKPGIYFLQVMSANEMIANQKIVIQ